LVVAAAQFASMKWVTEHLGARAVIAAGMGIKDQVREAIQLLSSKQMVERTVHTHTGWRTLDGGPSGRSFPHAAAHRNRCGAGARRHAQRWHTRRSRNSGLVLQPVRTQPWAG
jgi:hypothetical protein